MGLREDINRAAVLENENTGGSFNRSLDDVLSDLIVLMRHREATYLALEENLEDWRKVRHLLAAFGFTNADTVSYEGWDAYTIGRILNHCREIVILHDVTLAQSSNLLPPPPSEGEM